MGKAIYLSSDALLFWLEELFFFFFLLLLFIASQFKQAQFTEREGKQRREEGEVAGEPGQGPHSSERSPGPVRTEASASQT